MISTSQFIADHQSSTDAELAAALVEHAGQLALSMRARGLTTDQKTSVSDVVTEADHAAEDDPHHLRHEDPPAVAQPPAAARATEV